MEESQQLPELPEDIWEDILSRLPAISILLGQVISEKRPKSLRLPQLPWKVWVNILSRLPVKSILQGRFVCKGLRHVLTHPHFIKVHSQMLEQYPALLCLNYSTDCLTTFEIIGDGSNGGGDTTTTIHIHSSSAAVMKFELLKHYKFNQVATCNGVVGVVCFSCRSVRGFTRNTSFYVGNPLVDRFQDFARVEVEDRNRHEDSWIGGFGLSLKTKRYKIVAFYLVDGQIHVKICTIVPDPRWKWQDSWRDIGPFPRYARTLGPSDMIVGSYLDGGIHWLLFCDRHLPLISRLDLDSEQFEWLPTLESEDFQFEAASTKIMKLEVSGGHLIIYTGIGTMSIWVRMKESWMKKFVVKWPAGLTRCLIEDVNVLIYGRWVDEAAGRREAAEVLFYSGTFQSTFCTNGDLVSVCPYVPSLLSIYDDRLNFKRPRG